VDFRQHRLSDDSLVGKDTALAIEKGLAEARWYASPVPRHTIRELLERKDGPAIRDTLLWFALIIASGVCGFMLWGTLWAVIPFTIYGVLCASTSDSRWYEPGHGTAFKTDWMNNTLYEIASFMVLRESTRWRWSHARHHSDTIIVGRDPKIAVTRPPSLATLLLRFFGINTTFAFFRLVLLHCTGRLTPEEMNYRLEHHMFPLVPYHNLARLHELVKSDMPKPYSGLLEAWGEIIPAVFRQWKDPTYYIQRELPTPSIRADVATASRVLTAKGQPVKGWVATNPGVDEQLRFNVRISTPPRGRDCSAGAGSTYVHRLKPGDKVSAIGSFGTFHIKPTEKEMAYLGGGAGMAPLRSHLAHLFESEKTGRRVSFWYGARSLRESFYRDYFENLARQFPNFTFHLALSEPQPGDNWQSYTGFIHEVLRENHLVNHPDPTGIEYYLCGPPVMVQAALKMLASLNVDRSQIAFDEF
jgi:fatty acid desaturase/NAD(P)H-flavin reductase